MIKHRIFNPGDLVVFGFDAMFDAAYSNWPEHIGFMPGLYIRHRYAGELKAYQTVGTFVATIRRYSTFLAYGTVCVGVTDKVNDLIIR